MKNRVMVTKTKFHVDKENKIVICELNCDMQMEKHPAWIHLREEMWEKRFPNVKWGGRFTVKAKARCNSCDTFDEDKGKMISESRAKAKMFSIAMRVWKDCAKDLHTHFIKCCTQSVSCENAMQIELNHVKDLSV